MLVNFINCFFNLYYHFVKMSVIAYSLVLLVEILLFFYKKCKYVYEIFKKKLNLLKQEYYDKIPTDLFVFFICFKFFIFSKSITQTIAKEASDCSI